MSPSLLILYGVFLVVVGCFFGWVCFWQGLFVVLWLNSDKYRIHFTAKLLLLVLEELLIQEDK